MNILLVDDHALFREGLELVLLRSDPRLEITHADTVAAGVAQLKGSRPPDLVIADLGFPGIKGIETLLQLRATNIEVPIVILAGSEDPGLVRSAIEHGAMGYIPKSSESKELARALQWVVEGRVYLPAIAMSTEQEPPGPARPELRITSRQRDVLRSLVQGKPNKVIARELGISDTTVKTHVMALFQILDVNNRTQAVYAVARMGIALGADATAPG